MKKVKILLILLANTAIGLLPGCKKDVQIHDAKNTLKQAQHHTALSGETLGLDDLTYYQFGVDILEEDFLDNPEDQADEDFNYVEYAMTLCLLELQDNHPALLSSLVGKMNATEGKCYNLYTFASDESSIDGIFNPIFEDRFADFNTGQDWKSYVAANYHYDITYVPFVRFINMRPEETINFSKDILVAGAFEISEEKFLDFDDNIPVWTTPSLFTTINEAEAALIDNPIIAISNDRAGSENDKGKRFRDKEANGGNGQTSNKCNNPNHLHEKISHKRYKINERFERTGRSEYTFEWGMTTGYDFSISTWINFGSGAAQPLKGFCQCKVKKSELGDWFNEDHVLFTSDRFTGPNIGHLCFEIQNMTILQEEQMYFGAYERDWLESRKLIAEVQYRYPYTTAPIKGSKKYESDYYFFKPSTNTSYPVMTRHPNMGDTYIGGSNGRVDFKRWN